MNDPAPGTNGLSGGRSGRARTLRRRRLAALAGALALVAVLVVAISALGGSDDGAPSFVGSAGGDSDAPAGAAQEPVRFTVAATGDFLIHGPVYERAQSYDGGNGYDFSPMFEQIKPYIEDADLAICHVETPMGDGPAAGYPVFNTPADLTDAIASTGWDVCDTASNHTLDQGQAGVDDTIKALDKAGIEHTGSASSAAEQEEPPILDVNGVKVAFLAYTEMTNGVAPPKRYSVNLAKAPAILDDARAARDRGAEVVIVNMHWGEEFVAEPSDSQTKLAKKLTESPDITAVIGQHVHIVQPIDTVNGKIVVYGEGNLVSNQTVDCCPEASQDGLIALLDFVVDAEGARVESTRYVPVFVEHPDFTVQPIGDALDSGDGDEQALRSSYERTTDVVGKGPGIKPDPARLP